MRLELQTPARRLACAAVCLLVLAVYALSTLKHDRAARARASLRLEALEAATRLEPGNAENHFLLGRQFFFTQQDFPTAVQHYRQAASLNPHNAQYWLALAGAHQVTGRNEEQRKALERALWADPTAPDVAWEAANFYLVAGETPRALNLLRVVADNDASSLPAVVELSWRATGDAARILDEALPAETTAYGGLLSFLVAQKEPAAADLAWARLLALRQPVEPASAAPYLRSLIERREAGRAVQAWQELVTVNPGLKPYAFSENLVVNGGFENKLLNAGFDWISQPRWGLALSIDTTVFHSGTRSLAVNFLKQSVPDAGLSQFIPVRPNIRYEVTGFTRSADILSASGPRLTLEDAYSGKSYLLSDDTLGTTPWRELRREFTTGPETELLLLRLVRVPPHSRIEGRFWIDDLRLVAK